MIWYINIVGCINRQIIGHLVLSSPRGPRHAVALSNFTILGGGATAATEATEAWVDV